jgi:hypothetical protein
MLDNLDMKTIVLGLFASLSSYLFYGHIKMEARVEAMDTRLYQAESELDDIWAKYNEGSDKEVAFLVDYYESRAAVRVLEEKAAELKQQIEKIEIKLEGKKDKDNLMAF